MSRTDGRYHRIGEPGVFYASSQEQAAWAELFRHFVDEGIDPFEVRRKVGCVSCGSLKTLDLTDVSVLARLGIQKDDLISDDYALTQQIAADARDAGFDGILAPSAALPGQQTLIIFSHSLGKVSLVGRERVRQPPPRMVDFLSVIRLHPDVPTSVRRLLWVIRAGGRALVTSRRKFFR